MEKILVEAVGNRCRLQLVKFFSDTTKQTLPTLGSQFVAEHRKEQLLQV